MIAEEHTIGKTGDGRNVIAEPATDHSCELPIQAGSVPANVLRSAGPARSALRASAAVQSKHVHASAAHSRY